MRKLFFLFISLLFLNITQAQNVGIGTITPSKPLDVALPGGIKISRTENGSSNNEILFSDNGQIRSLDDFHRIVFNRSNDQMEFNEFGKILFKTGNPLTEAMRINTNGFVGIGTTLPLTPNNLLSVGGGITIDYNNQNNGTIANVISFGSSGGEGIGSARIAFPVPVNSHGLDFYTNYTKRVSIDAGGNVGIGTAIPGAKLDVEGNVKIADGTQGDGKALTSDGDGNAYWKDAPAKQVYFEAALKHNGFTFNASFGTALIMDTLLRNDGNTFNISTSTFTAPSTGLYHFFCQVEWGTTFTDGYIMLSVNGNIGEARSRWSRRINVNNSETQSAEASIYLNAGETLQFKIAASLNVSVTIISFQQMSYLQGYKIY